MIAAALLFSLLLPFSLKAETGRTPAHFFNAHQLRSGTLEANALSQIRWGVTDELEINTLGFTYLVRPTLWNIGLKHQMFRTERSLTSFNSHSFYFKSGPDSWLISLHGLVSSYQISPDHSLNLGLMDGLVLTFSPDSQASLHLITPLVGWDWIVAGPLSLSAMFARPVYAIGQLESDLSGEGNLEIDFTRKSYNPGLGFLTLQYAWKRTRLEVGTIYLAADAKGQFAPYLNFFWRFGDGS